MANRGATQDPGTLDISEEEEEPKPHPTNLEAAGEAVAWDKKRKEDHAADGPPYPVEGPIPRREFGRGKHQKFTVELWDARRKLQALGKPEVKGYGSSLSPKYDPRDPYMRAVKDLRERIESQLDQQLAEEGQFLYGEPLSIRAVEAGRDVHLDRMQKLKGYAESMTPQQMAQTPEGRAAIQRALDLLEEYDRLLGNQRKILDGQEVE